MSNLLSVGGISNSNSNVLIFKVIVILIIILNWLGR